MNSLKSQIAGLQSQMASFQVQLGPLPAENAKLKADLEAANKAIASFVNRILNGKTDINVATAVRDTAYKMLMQASTTAGARDPRVRRAQAQYNEGLSALRAGRYFHAVREFREAYDLSERVLRH